MALINENIKQNLANNLVANYDDSGVGTGINGQPLQVSSYGNLKSADRIEYNIIDGGTWSAQDRVTAWDEVGSALEGLRSQLATVMNSTGNVYAYEYKEYVVHDGGWFNLYACAWINNV